MKNKLLKLFAGTLLFSMLVSCGCSNNNTDKQNDSSKDPTIEESIPHSLELLIEDSKEPVNEIHLLEEESVKINVNAVGSSLNLTYKFEFDDPNVAIYEDGYIKGLSTGDAVLTVTCVEYPNVSKLAFVNVTRKVGQTGTGSGRIAEDPIFIGNEGIDEPVEIYFIEVQKQYADAVYIKKGLVDILIDAGTVSDGYHVKEFLTEHMEDNTLDLVMVSHTHDDHYGGMSTALSAVENVSLFLDYGGDSKNSYSNARDNFIAKGAKYYGAYDCVNYLNNAVKEWFITEDFTCEILNTDSYIKDYGSAGNSESVAALFKYKDFTYFTAGDLTSSSEISLMRHEELNSVSLYKASHHCSNGSNTTELLNVLDPYCVGISAAIVGNGPSGQSGITGHPGTDAVERIYKAPQIRNNLNVYFNGVNGDMCFTTYGGAKDITFKGSPTKKGYYVKGSDGDLTKVEGEENLKFHETKLFELRGYTKFLQNNL